MNHKSRKVLYLVAGIYLLYLSFQLITGAVEGNNGNVVVSVIGGGLFLILGIFLIVDYIRNLKRGFDSEEPEEEQNTEVVIEEKEEEEE